MSEKIVQTAGRKALGEFAPEFAHFNDDVLFGENWNNQDIDLKTRCVITMVALMSQGITDSSLVYHIQNAKANGIYDEGMEPLTEKERFQKEIFFPIGDPNDGFAQYFVGQSYLAPVSTEQVMIFNVTFEPGCRNNWHIHHASKGGGQMLIGVGGKGWYQEEGKPAQEILPGTVIHIPANVKHWHGAQKDSWFSHLAFEIEGENASNEWCEPVIDEEYLSL
ncbi:carboxymuconolactone decarboxylase family protein [uncultured Haemophilus sp.]|uniref:carboxymuconolactone decarboxylase family protein n=1 Tax=uncultured Haemophilus sp. TaxID=237779 RepID=UPI002804C183|nr:carboxymuconolactone decarboxylase family protein [uncultured Haemophilus sp.]MDU6706686.1 carboxymuconolactone decarboxylase family protein [Haemophilus parainfluenzae]